MKQYVRIDSQSNGKQLNITLRGVYDSEHQARQVQTPSNTSVSILPAETNIEQTTVIFSVDREKSTINVSGSNGEAAATVASEEQVPTPEPQEEEVDDGA